MNAITQNQVEHTVTEAFRVDTSRGRLDSTMNRIWSSRGDDERYVNLPDLRQFCFDRHVNSESVIVESSDLLLRAEHDSNELAIAFRNSDNAHPIGVSPNNWSFGQLSTLAGAPAGYLQKLPARLAAINLQYGLKARASDSVKLYHRTDTGELMATNGPNYGRIPDYAVVDQIMRIAGNGTGDTRWKVPGVMLWGEEKYNPFVDVTTETTTLFASDRDIAIFLVDDTHPIEIGKLPDGSPDMLFRGILIQHSEMGAKKLTFRDWLMRGVCANRNMWGVEDASCLSIRHSKGAPDRFARELEPALLTYSESATLPIIEKVTRAKEAIVARDDDDRTGFLKKQGFSQKRSADILKSILNEEQHPASSIWDMVQGITAVARTIPQTDNRLELESVAGKLMAKV